MTCDQLREEYDLYALGLADPEQSREIAAHLRSDCSNCVPAVGQSLALAAELSYLAPQVNPPDHLRNRIIAAVNPAFYQQQPRRAFGWSLVWGAVSALLLALVVLLGLQTRRLGVLRLEDSNRLRSALVLLSAPDSQEINFGTDRALPPRGRVVINRREGVVLIASNLPVVQPGKSFELWLISKDGAPLASGSFRAASDGSGFIFHPGHVPDNLGAVAVTVEDEAGVPAPTTKPIIVAPATAAGA